MEAVIFRMALWLGRGVLIILSASFAVSRELRTRLSISAPSHPLVA